jgi:hypothetical protein
VLVRGIRVPAARLEKEDCTMNRYWLLAGLVALLITACGGDSNKDPVIDPGDGGNYAPVIDAANFVAQIDNPYLPLIPGTRWSYESTDGVETTEVEVLADRRQILGITATVVHDTVYEDGELIEDTFDWFAQDTEGNVWYLGEDSKEYEDGEVVSTGGSWEAGVDGAQPGIVMHASPQVGVGYRQEYYRGEAEDLAEVLRLDAEATVPFGSYQDVVVIQEWNPLDPDVVENKYYASGIGVVLEETVKGGNERVELVSFDKP